MGGWNLFVRKAILYNLVQVAHSPDGDDWRTEYHCYGSILIAANRIIAIQFGIAIESIIARSLYRCSLQAYKMRSLSFHGKSFHKSLLQYMHNYQNTLQDYSNEFYTPMMNYIYMDGMNKKGHKLRNKK